MAVSAKADNARKTDKQKKNKKRNPIAARRQWKNRMMRKHGFEKVGHSEELTIKFMEALASDFPVVTPGGSSPKSTMVHCLVLCFYHILLMYAVVQSSRSQSLVATASAATNTQELPRGVIFSKVIELCTETFIPPKYVLNERSVKWGGVSLGAGAFGSVTSGQLNGEAVAVKEIIYRRRHSTKKAQENDLVHQAEHVKQWAEK